MIKSFIKNHWPTFAGLAIGAVAGYLYWMYIGCETGSCPITSSPIASAAYGSLIGGIILNGCEVREKKNNI